MIVVTGANGFVGQAVIRALLRRGEAATGLVRQARDRSGDYPVWVDDQPDFLGIERAWPPAASCEAVIHLAARVHVMQDEAADPLAAYRETNVAGALRVAAAARRAGARRFVFVSSIKAIGERSSGCEGLSEQDEPAPTDPYGISKLEAERALREYGRDSGLDVVIVRPPLVYGPGVRANFLSLMRAVAKGLPLPLGAIGAKRSLIFVENLADALIQCALDPRAGGQTFHVADQRALDVAELVRALAVALEVRPRLVPVPVNWLRTVGRVAGRSAQVERLVEALQLDTRHIQAILGWQPPYAVEAGLRETAVWYRSVH